MKNILFSLTVVVLVFPALVWAADIPQPSSYAELMVGEWEIAPYDGVLSGRVVFNPNGTHNTEEKHTDGHGAGRKGGYVLDISCSPARVQLCVGECGIPGSEWTTLFSIVRFHSEDSMEIRFSPDGTYPAEFAKGDDDYTMMLTRTK